MDLAASVLLCTTDIKLFNTTIDLSKYGLTAATFGSGNLGPLVFLKYYYYNFVFSPYFKRQLTSYKVFPPNNVPFGGFVDMPPHLGVKSPKTPILEA